MAGSGVGVRGGRPTGRPVGPVGHRGPGPGGPGPRGQGGTTVRTRGRPVGHRGPGPRGQGGTTVRTKSTTRATESAQAHLLGNNSTEMRLKKDRTPKNKFEMTSNSNNSKPVNSSRNTKNSRGSKRNKLTWLNYAGPFISSIVYFVSGIEFRPQSK